jgi:hypothetical protein
VVGVAAGVEVFAAVMVRFARVVNGFFLFTNFFFEEPAAATRWRGFCVWVLFMMSDRMGYCGGIGLV